MNYKNAQDILPDRLLKELQQYVSGETIYIPNADEKKNGAVSLGQETFTDSAMNAFGICVVKEEVWKNWQKNSICR